VSYRERPSGLPGVVLWQRTAAGPSRILPDGCLDLIWDGRHLIVAGPDTAARRTDAAPGTDFVGLRFHYGIGPALLGVAASDVLDQSPRLDAVWSSGSARRLAERVAEDPVAALTGWLAQRVRDRDVDPIGVRVHSMASRGVPVGQMAERLGLSERQLHRRCRPVFGYGPRRLGRILRLNRAVDAARAGVPLAQVAAECGYADQAHLSRDLLALGGASPTALLREHRELAGQVGEEVDGVAVGVAH
jgi:AraC-like DNA-binding protein